MYIYFLYATCKSTGSVHNALLVMCRYSLLDSPLSSIIVNFDSLLKRSVLVFYNTHRCAFGW